MTADMRGTTWTCWLSAAVAVLGTAACNPTVKVEAPDKPIVINMNIKIDQEVRVKLDREAEQLLQQRDDLF